MEASRVYIVQLRQPAAIAARDDKEAAHLRAARRQGKFQGKFDAHSTAVRSYGAGLVASHDQLLESVGATDAKLYSYRLAFNGFAARLTPAAGGTAARGSLRGARVGRPRQAPQDQQQPGLSRVARRHRGPSDRARPQGRGCRHRHHRQRHHARSPEFCRPRGETAAEHVPVRLGQVLGPRQMALRPLQEAAVPGGVLHSARRLERDLRDRRPVRRLRLQQKAHRRALLRAGLRRPVLDGCQRIPVAARCRRSRDAHSLGRGRQSRDRHHSAAPRSRR